MHVKAGPNIKPVPQGLHLAVCTEVVDLGTQTSEYKGKKRSARKVYIGFHLPNVLLDDGDHAGEPRRIGQRFTASIGNKATLRTFLESWRGKAFTEAELADFNLANVLGKPGQMQVQHETSNGKTYANIKAMVSVMPGTPIPKVDQSSIVLFDLDSFDSEVFDGLPDWQKELIVKSPEYDAAINGGGEKAESAAPATQPGAADGVDPDDIQF